MKYTTNSLYSKKQFVVVLAYFHSFCAKRTTLPFLECIVWNKVQMMESASNAFFRILVFYLSFSFTNEQLLHLVGT